MKDIIQAFLDDRKIAIVGASSKKENFGRTIMTELTKLEYEVHPVNPSGEVINGTTCVPTVKELPKEVENVILAVPASLTSMIIKQCIGTSIKRVWMLKGIGKGTYSDEAYSLCKEYKIEVVHGFCPLMFFGGGAHKFHLWIKENFGKVPDEYLN